MKMVDLVMSIEFLCLDIIDVIRKRKKCNFIFLVLYDFLYYLKFLLIKIISLKLKLLKKFFIEMGV